MTFYEIKSELEMARNTRRQIRSMRKELDTFRDDMLAKANSGAIDYTKERLQSTHDPDAKMIYTIEYINKEEEKRKAKIIELEESVQPYEQLVYSLHGLETEVLRLFYLEDWPMEKVAAHINYDVTYAYSLRNKALNKLVEQEARK